MFHVGRYDPSQDPPPGAHNNKNRKKKEARISSNAEKNQPNENETKQEHKRRELRISVNEDEEVVDNMPQKVVTDSESKKGNDVVPMALDESDDDSKTSSSVPSSESSSDDDDSDDDDYKDSTDREPALKVIAPEQKFISNKRLKKSPDEALDDFDIVQGEDSDESSDEQDNDESTGPHTSNDKKQQPNHKKHSHSHNRKELETALHMSKLPIEQAAAAWNLAPFLVKNLKNDGYPNFFPIQSLVIPDVIATERSAHVRARDICVSAPTGSGKTLAFVLPVLNALSKRKVRRLRALVVLPTRDLASQVYHVFQRYVEGSDLKVGLAIGQTDFYTEQCQLILDPKQSFRNLNAKIAHELNPTDIYAALMAHTGLDVNKNKYNDSNHQPTIPRQGISALDILVATPGRLVTHLEKTPGFTLQHLHFLIIDEADRLLNQSYQNWIPKVHQAVDATATATATRKHHANHFSSTIKNKKESKVDNLELKLASNGLSYNIDPYTYRKSESNTTCAMLQPVNRAVQLRKFLFSATLTKDPQKLSALGLIHPKHFDAHHLKEQSTISSSGKGQRQHYSLPEQLEEYTVQCTAQQKPLALLGLILHELSTWDQNSHHIVVVFAVSLDATHRLTRLLQLLWASSNYGPAHSIAEFSSSLNHKQRTQLLQRCNEGKVSIVVCSDGMSRGLDIPTINTVVHYDVPSFAKTYVHRCGRTARAGRSGKAITILKSGQVKQFEKMRSLIDDFDRVKNVGVRKEDVVAAIRVYPKCLKRLKEVIEAEKENSLDTNSPLGLDWFVSIEGQNVNVNKNDGNESDSSSSVPSSSSSDELDDGSDSDSDSDSS